jgi:hypothetical protein
LHVDSRRRRCCCREQCSEVVSYAERYQQIQLAAMTQILDQRGISAEICPPIVALLAITGISQTLMLGESVGLTAGHDEAITFIENYLASQDQKGCEPPL